MFDLIYRVALGPAVILALIVTGGYFSVRLRLFWVRHPRRSLRLLRGGRSIGGALAAVTMALAGTLGVGNIAGVALALILGGPGAVAWMLLSAFFAMAVKYAEVVLAMDTRRRISGEWVGGSLYYMRRRGLIGRILPIIFSILCVACALLQGGVIQASAAAEAVSLSLGVAPVFAGIALTIGATFILVCGRSGIARVTTVAIPLATCIYMVMCMVVLLTNISAIPSAFLSVLQGVFTPTAGVGGIAGYLFSAGARQGCAKGLLSNEAGCGTAPTAHVTAEGTTPVGQGLFGIFEVFLDTVVVCTLTALACLVVLPEGSADAPVAYIIAVFSAAFGRAAPHLTALCIVIFAFSTTLSWAFYGMSSLGYLTKARWAHAVYLIIYCLSLTVGSVASPALVFTLTDILLALMTLINLPVLAKKADRVVTLSANEGMIKFSRRRGCGTAQRRRRLKDAPDSPRTRAR